MERASTAWTTNQSSVCLRRPAPASASSSAGRSFQSPTTRFQSCFNFFSCKAASCDSPYGAFLAAYPCVVITCVPVYCLRCVLMLATALLLLRVNGQGVGHFSLDVSLSDIFSSDSSSPDNFLPHLRHSPADKAKIKAQNLLTNFLGEFDVHQLVTMTSRMILMITMMVMMMMMTTTTTTTTMMTMTQMIY